MHPLTVTLPSLTSANPPPTPRRQVGILVVDDEPLVRDVLAAVLTRAGFRVWLAASGLEALEFYRRDGHLIDLILLDVVMPGLDGPTTLLVLRTLNPNLICCMMSGSMGNYTEEDLRGLGVRLLIHKPFDLAHLAATLRQLLNSAA